MALEGYFDDNEWPGEPRFMRVDGQRFPVCFNTYVQRVPGETHGTTWHFYNEPVAPEYVAWGEDFVTRVARAGQVVVVDDNWNAPVLYPVKPMHQRLPIEFEIRQPGLKVLVRTPRKDR